MENKKELNENEVEKVSGGNGGEQKDGSRPWSNRIVMYGGPKPHVDKIPYIILNNGPARPMDKIIKKFKEEQNNDKEKPEKGKLSE